VTTPTVVAPPSEPDYSRPVDGPRHPTGRIGLIVAASVATGAISALVLDLVVFAGAEEDTITGVTLLAFALGWAVLALLSTRRTDQPQRWAWVPAAAMAVLGLGHLILRPSDHLLNVFGWIWPLPLLALVVWMFVQARRHLHTRTRPWLVYPVLIALGLASVGGAYERIAETRDAGSLAMSGRLIDVGGHKLHINCTGSGSPTVVLEPGLGDTSSMMSGWIAPAVAKTTRVCVYDRAGRGWSEASPSPRDGVGTATDLHSLLARAGEAGPFVLAGHSAGGVYVLNFAKLYPDQVAGVVLLDSMHPEQYTRISSWPGFYEGFRRASALLPSLSRIGVGRLFYQASYGGLPSGARAEERAFLSTAQDNRSVRDEFSQIRTAMAQAGALRTLGNTPLIVVTATEGTETGWAAAQADLAKLSTNSVHRTVAATHAALTEDEKAAAQSSQAITDMVQSIRAAGP
jgi:pimeloyl-ACP methyl ester carboxylesterase